MVGRSARGAGQVPLYAQPPPRTRKSTIIISVLALILLVFVLIAFNPFGGGSNASSAGSSGSPPPDGPVPTGSGPGTGSVSGAQTPAAAVVRFVAAARAKDLAAVQAVTCAAQLKKVTSVPNIPTGMTVQLRATDETGPTATVPLPETYPGQTHSETATPPTQTRAMTNGGAGKT